MQTPGTGFLCKHASGFLRFSRFHLFFKDYGAHLWAETFLQAKSNNKLRELDSVPSVSVFWQRPGDNHGGQPALYPAAALHCWCAPLASHLRCHRRDWLRWELTSNGRPHDHWHFPKTTFYFFFLNFTRLALNCSPALCFSDSIGHSSLRCVSQVSGTATGSTEPWAGSRAPTSPSLTSASTPTSVCTFSSAKHGLSSVGYHSLAYPHNAR